MLSSTLIQRWVHSAPHYISITSVVNPPPSRPPDGADEVEEEGDIYTATDTPLQDAAPYRVINHCRHVTFLNRSKGLTPMGINIGHRQGDAVWWFYRLACRLSPGKWVLMSTNGTVSLVWCYLPAGRCSIQKLIYVTV